MDIYVSGGSYDASRDSDYFSASDEEREKAEQENEKARKLFSEGYNLYNNGHYSDGISAFLRALDFAHDSDLKSDCKEMIARCEEGLADLYMR